MKNRCLECGQDDVIGDAPGRYTGQGCQNPACDPPKVGGMTELARQHVARPTKEKNARM